MPTDNKIRKWRRRTGCLTCGNRKIGCDEKKPVCGQCTRSERPCIPNPGPVFRHQHNPSMNRDDSRGKNPLKGIYAHETTPRDDDTWLDIPKNVTFVNITNPYLDPGTPDFDNIPTASVRSSSPYEVEPTTPMHTHSTYPSVTSTPSSLGPESAPTSVPFCYTPGLKPLPSLMQTPPPSTVGTPMSPPVSSCNQGIYPSKGFSAGVNAASPPISPRLNSPYNSADQIHPSPSVSSPRWSVPRSDGETSPADDQEIAFLRQYFSQGLGNWMDLFDPNRYFTSDVAVKAHDNPLLKYAAVACAAKALARVQARKPTIGVGLTHPVWKTQYSDLSIVHWKHRAAKYYDAAVSQLLRALKMDVVPSPEQSECQQTSPFSGSNETVCPRSQISSNASLESNMDELLAASTILCVYELLDMSGKEWETHFNGAKSILELSQQHSMLQGPTPTSTSLCYRAAFWNIARQDVHAALINKTRTRFDTEDSALWREAGLPIGEQGFITRSDTGTIAYLEDSNTKTREDVMCNALVWLMAKLVNFMAAGDKISAHCGMTWAGDRKPTLLEYWYNLQNQFEVWHKSLAHTVQPSAGVPHSHPASQSPLNANATILNEAQDTIPICVSTKQTYYMSQILLLMNKPHEPTQGRTNSYECVLHTCQELSRKIVGISDALSDDAVRIHSVQPLFVAGQCLSDSEKRQVVLDLLRNIESETGWATDYCIRQLIEHWQREELKDIPP